MRGETPWSALPIGGCSPNSQIWLHLPRYHSLLILPHLSGIRRSPRTEQCTFLEAGYCTQCKQVLLHYYLAGPRNSLFCHPLKRSILFRKVPPLRWTNFPFLRTVHTMELYYIYYKFWLPQYKSNTDYLRIMLKDHDIIICYF